MADIVDLASDLVVLSEELALKAIRLKKKEGFLGACLNCEEKISTQIQFCSVECRDDWEKRKLHADRIGKNLY